MTDQLDFSALMDRRKLTTAVAGILKTQLTGYLATLSPLLRPRAILGEHTRGGTAKVKGADEAFGALKDTYLKVAGSRMFDLPKVLESPIGISSAEPEINACHYSYDAVLDGNTKPMTITSPTRWVLTYKGLNEARLQALLAQKSDMVGRELAEVILHFVTLEVVVSRQSGIVDLLSELGFTVEIDVTPEYDALPLVFISSQVGTERPADELLVRVSEVSGSPAFDELVRIEDIESMKMPLQERLLRELQNHDGPTG